MPVFTTARNFAGTSFNTGSIAKGKTFMRVFVRLLVFMYVETASEINGRILLGSFDSTILRILPMAPDNPVLTVFFAIAIPFLTVFFAIAAPFFAVFLAAFFTLWATFLTLLMTFLKKPARRLRLPRRRRPPKAASSPNRFPNRASSFFPLCQSAHCCFLPCPFLPAMHFLAQSCFKAPFIFPSMRMPSQHFPWPTAAFSYIGHTAKWTPPSTFTAHHAPACRSFKGRTAL